MAERDPGPGSEGGSTAPGTGLAGFVEELRRRRVFRALLGYGIVAFAILQVIEPVLHGLHLPDGLLTAVVIALGAGLPLTVLVSWAYDLKGASLVRAPGPARGSPWLLAGMVAAGALLGAGVAWGALRHAQPEARKGTDGRVLVAVADFANDTRDPELDGLSGLLITSLEQSKALRILTRGRMLELLRAAGRTGVEQIDEASAREVGRQVGATALLHASIRLLGGAYVVDLRAVDPARDEYLFTLRETAAGKGEVLALVDRLSAGTRRRLRDESGGAGGNATRVGEGVTSDLEAYQHFFRGDQHLEAFRLPQAMEEYGKALASDPDFALAHLRIAWLGDAVGLPKAARLAAIDAAVRNIGRVPPREALFIRAMKAREDGHRPEAHALADEAVRSFPESKEALYLASNLFWEELRWVEAVPLLERAVALDPTWLPAVNNLLYGLSMLGRFDEAAVRARAYAEKAPSATAFRALATALVGSGRPLEALAVARRAVELDDTPFSRMGLAEVLEVADRPEEAEGILRALAVSGAQQPVRRGSSFRLVGAVAAQGRLSEAIDVANAIPPGPDGETDLSDWARLLLLMCGEPSAEGRRLARAMARSSDAMYQEFAPFHLLLHGDEAGAAVAAGRLGPGAGRAHYEATLAWRSGDRERALAILREAARTAGRFEAGMQWQIARYAFELERGSEVIAATEALARMPSGPWRGVGFAQALYWAADSHQRRGEPARAVEKLDRLLLLWRRADPDLQLLKDARALRAGLGSHD